jgi:hypothetical protein
VTQENRKALWDELKEGGFTFTKHYRDYSEAELHDNVEQLRARNLARARTAAEDPESELTQAEIHFQADLDALLTTPADTVPGLRTNTHGDEKPLRIDETGKIWYRDYIPKPGYAKERGKRHITYTDPGVKTVHVRDANDSIVESFEMPGDSKRESRATIALPAYQIGCYRDPAVLGEFFKIHVYGDKQVFDLFDVQRYFGCPRQVPPVVKRDYADTMLGYDIDSVLQAINDEYREKVLRGEIKA